MPSRLSAHSCSPVVDILNAQNWLNSLSSYLSIGKILNSFFEYTNNPPPIPAAVSLLSRLRSNSKLQSKRAREASNIVLLHHVSVNRIISGFESCATAASSPSLLLMLWAFVQRIFTVWLCSWAVPCPPPRPSLAQSKTQRNRVQLSLRLRGIEFSLV